MKLAMLILALCTLTLVACSTNTTTPADSGSSGGDAAVAVCEPGADQSCNDNPAFSSLHGRCLADRTCECAAGVEKNPDTGRCL
jgi:hypothetical protein